MKRILITLLLVGYVLAGQDLVAQSVDRSKAPEPGPAPVIELGESEQFTLKNGLRVILVENHKLPRASFNLMIDRDPLVEGDKVGLLNFTGQLLRRGTASKSKEQIDEAIDFIGASLSTSSVRINGSSLSKHKTTVLELMQDILMNPTFPETELEKIRKEALSGLEASQSDASFAADNVRGVVMYGADHPYGEVQTEEDINNITAADCRAYFERWWKPNIAYLVIVGDVNLKEAKKLSKKYFGDWEPGETETLSYADPVAPAQTQVAFVDRPASVQSVINVCYPVEMTPGHPDYIKATVMNGILGGGVFAGRLMRELRETHAWTYGAFSRLSSDKLIGNFRASTSTRNEVTDSAIAVILEEMDRLRKEPVAEDDLQLMKNFMNGNFALGLENPATIARFALNTARYNLPEDYYSTYLEKLSAVTAADVLEMAKKYIKPENAWVVVVGKGSEVAAKLERFGPVSYFDIFAQETTFNPAPPVPAGTTAQTVLQQYIDAVGGAEQIKAIQDISIVREAAMGGSGTLVMQTYNAAPNKYALKLIIKEAGMVLQSTVYDGSKVLKTQGGSPQEITEADATETKIRSYLIPELYYEQEGASLSLAGTELVAGRAAYAVEVTFPNGGRAFTAYFDMETGLKLQSVSVNETPNGPVTSVTSFHNYQAYEGVKLPLDLSISAGPNTFELKHQTVEVNTGLSDELFATD